MQMGYVSFYSVFSVVTTFLLLFFAFFLLTLRKGNATAHRLLAAFLTALVFSYLDGTCILFRGFFYAHFPHIFYVGTSFDFLVGPLLWLYILARRDAALRPRPVWLLHALPFALHLLFMAARFHLHPADAKREMLDTWTVMTYGEVVASSLLVHLHLGVYCVLALRSLSAYRSGLEESQAADRPQRLSWMRTVTVGFFLIWSLRLLNSMLWLHVPELALLQHVDVRPFVVLFVFLFACVMFLKALRRPEVIYAEEKIRYQTAVLSDELKQDYLARLRAYMERERPYLNPSLDLRTLAEGAAIPQHHVSQVLNSCLRQNFFDFVNSYRVRACQALLADPRNAYKNISELMYEVGFNSKSVFNTAFKKFAGTTPSQYRASTVRSARNGVREPA